MMKSIASMSLCLLLAACSANEPTTEVEPPSLPQGAANYITGMVRVSELATDPATGVLVLDLRDTRDGFWFESDLDLKTVDIICPSGRVMNIGAWMNNLATEPGASFAEGEDFVVFSSTKDPPVSNAAPVCNVGCELELESNGKWTCVCTGGPQ